MITVSQQKTYQFIKRFIKQQGHSPTIAEIAKGIGLKSRGVVHRYVQALIAEKLITISPNRHRNIELIDTESDRHLMLIGQIAHNKPLEMISDQKVTDVAKALLGENRCALKVKGDGMMEEGIFDGDIIICERKTEVENNSVVIALIDEKKAVVKRYQDNEDHTISLLPVHSRLLPQVYTTDRVQIYGVFIGLIRLEQ